MASDAAAGALSPYIVSAEADAVLEFLVAAFGAEAPEAPFRRSDGTLLHAVLTLGGGTIMLAHPGASGEERTAMCYLTVGSCDTAYAAALEGGAEIIAEPADQLYGHRTAAVRDPGGNIWWLAEAGEPVARETVEARFKELGL